MRMSGISRRVKTAITLALAVVTVTGTVASNTLTVEASQVRLTNVSQVARQVFNGYVEEGRQNTAPISVTPITLNYGWYRENAYLITLSGTELRKNQATGIWTDLLSGFNQNNKYVWNVKQVLKQDYRVRRGAKLVFAGHSLGGMIAQQLAADDEIKQNYEVIYTVCFGSPLLSAGSREGTVKRLGDTNDVIPYCSGSTFNNFAWQVAGLNREDGGYFGNPNGAHNESYLRADVWGAYDVVGQKYGYTTMTYDTNQMWRYTCPNWGF